MSIQIEGTPAPDSLEAKALAELEKEGHVIEGKEPAIDNPPEPAKKEEPKVDPKPEPEKPVEEPKPDRTPTMVEAWKLKVAEDQKAGLSRQVDDLQKKLEEASRQKGPVTQSQKDEISDDVEAVIKKAEESGTDGTFLREFAKTILNKAKPSGEIEKTLSELKQERELEKQINAYQDEFDTDVLPLVKEYNLSDTALLQLRNQLKDLAFSETYARVPVKEIFLIKKDTFELKAPKRSSESKTVKTRASDVVDLENIDEDSFKNLSPEQIEQFMRSKSSGGWVSNKK